MKVGKTLYVSNRKAWRLWLAKNYKIKKEIWLIYYKKHTAKKRIPYNDAVEEAICYGWIDSTVKKIDEERTAQRFTPRREKSLLSQLNKERAMLLIKSRKIIPSVLQKIERQLNEPFVIAEDIIAALKRDRNAWKSFQEFPQHYKRVRVAFIEGARKRPEEFKRRLKNFLKMTSKNKKFGMMR